MTTAQTVIDQTKSSFLYPGNEGAPEWDTLGAQMLVGATSMTTSGLLTYVPKTVVQIGWELIQTRDAETTTTVDGLERGFRETTAAQHEIGDKVFIDPTFGDLEVYQALQAVIGDLYGMGIYKRTLDTDETASSTPFDLDTGTMKVCSVRYLNGTRYLKAKEGLHYEVMHEFSPPKMQWTSGPEAGAALRIVSALDFTNLNDDPTNAAGAAADLTTTCGIPASLVRHLPMAVAGYVLRGRELSRVQLEEIRSRLAAEQVPVGSNISLAEQLISLFERKYVDREAQKLRELDGVRTRFRR